MSQTKEVTLRLTEEEVKSLDTLAWQEEQRLDLSLLSNGSGPGMKVRASVVNKIQKATRMTYGDWGSR